MRLDLDTRLDNDLAASLDIDKTIPSEGFQNAVPIGIESRIVNMRFDMPSNDVARQMMNQVVGTNCWCNHTWEYKRKNPLSQEIISTQGKD